VDVVCGGQAKTAVSSASRRGSVVSAHTWSSETATMKTLQPNRFSVPSLCPPCIGHYRPPVRRQGDSGVTNGRQRGAVALGRSRRGGAKQRHQKYIL